MNEQRIGKDLIQAISKMEEVGEKHVALLLLELAQYRLTDSFKAENNFVVKDNKAA
ncbi:MAG: hypothetical protein JSW07_04805 [bacterium]|nr:MAG: hypothetical protein JSW07_04805 [bacterium]